MISPEKIAEMLAEPVAPETLLIYLRGCLSRVDDEGMVNVPAGYITDSIAHVTELPSSRSELLTLRAERDEAREHAAHWHGACQSIAVVLGLPEPEEGFAGVVRDRFAAAEAQLARQGEALKAGLAELERLRSKLLPFYEGKNAEPSQSVIEQLRSTLSPEDSHG